MQGSGAWSPYLVGALIGLLSMATFYFSNKPLSVSTAYARVAGMIGNLFSKTHTQNLKFYLDNKPKVEWQVMLVVGMLLGAVIAAVTGGEFSGEWVPAMWEQRFGPDVALRLGMAFLGGALLAYGARLAGGCTSGHGISGALQLSVGSWVALACFFIAGVATAMLLYRL
jgi:uncharacterized membrane protein YedE/YeeE